MSKSPSPLRNRHTLLSPLRTRAVLKAACAEYGGEIEARRRGQWRTFICPHCDDHSGHLGVNVQSGRVRCLKCGHRDSMRRLLKEYALGIPETPPTVPAVGPPSRPAAIPGYRRWDTVESPVVDAGRSLFLERGIEPIDVEWGVSDNAQLALRIILPITTGGVLVSYQARVASSLMRPKYLTAPTAEGWKGASECLYNYDHAPDHSRIVICEGPFDALRTNGVALFGTSISTVQLGLIAQKEPTDIIVALDADAHAQSVDTLARVLRYPFPTVPTIRLVRYSDLQVKTRVDPASLTEQELAALLDSAIPVRTAKDLVPIILRTGADRPTAAYRRKHG